MGNQVVSFKAANTIPAYRIVYLSAANTVNYGITCTNFPVGITQDTVLDTGCGIPVQLNGISKLYFNDSVAAGALFTTNTLGMGVPFALGALTGTAYAVGVLLGTKVNTTGTVAEVLINQISR